MCYAYYPGTLPRNQDSTIHLKIELIHLRNTNCHQGDMCIGILSIYCEIAFRWLPQHRTGD